MYENEQRLEILDKNIEVNIDNYKNIWDRINELAFVIEVDGLFVPKCFIDANNKVCNRLGYSKENFIKATPSDIFSFNKKGNILELYRDLIYKKCNEKGGSAKLKSLKPDVEKLFKLTRLDKVFEIYP